MLQNRDDAEDVVHGLFVDLLSKGQTDPELPYLYRAVTNRCINLARGRENRRRLRERQEPALRGPVRVRCDEHVIGLDLMLKLLARLDRRSREIVAYRYVDEMTQQEIAELMGVSRKTVGKRLVKIRREVERMVANGNGGRG